MDREERLIAWLASALRHLSDEALLAMVRAEHMGRATQLAATRELVRRMAEEA